ncbi:MAG: TonB-dependent siderophore receptor [Vibrio sp.]
MSKLKQYQLEPQQFKAQKRKQPLALSLLSLTIWASLSPSAMANEEESMDQMTVMAKSYRNTATKTALTPEETPQGISVVSQQALKERAPRSIGETLRYVPGVNAELKGGSVVMYDNYNIRGFDNNQMYYDGLVLQYLLGWNLQPQIDPFALEQVEVFKGPSSVLYGAMPPGGMVNLIAKAPQKESATQVSAATGTGNLKQVTFDSTGQIGDSDVNYRIIAKARKKDGQIDSTEEERYLIAPSLDWAISDSTSLNLNLYYQNDPNMGMNSAIPASGSVYSNANGSMDSSMFVGDENWSKFKREFLMVGYKLNHEFNQNWSFLQNARYMNADLHQDNTYHVKDAFKENTGDLERYIYSTDEESEGFAIDNQVSGYVATGAIEHNLLFGIDYQKLTGRSDYTDYGTDGVDFNVFKPDNNLINVGSLSVAGVYTDKIDAEQIGYYFQDQMQWDRLTVMAGGRFDHYESESDYVGSVTEANQREFSYRVGALYAFDSGISPYANYATSFEPTPGVDENGDSYKPELGKQVEVGVKYQSFDQRQNLTASYFHIEKQDALMADPTNPWGPELQLGEVRSQGFELEGQFMLNDSWDLAASYAYTDIEITKDSDGGLEGKTPIYVPKHSATLWSNYYLDEGLLAGTRIGGGVRYVGEREMDAQNTDKVPDYTLVDLSMGYDLGELSNSMSGATVNLSANNIFDKDNFTCYDSANCWYGQERTVEVSFDYNF